MKIRKKIIFASLAVGLLCFTTAQAAEIVVPSKDNPNINIGTAESHKNLYTAGSNVTINSNTQGDLVAAGGLVTVDGNVQQEAMVAGGTINLNGAIGGHARIAGGNVTISGTVGGDLVVGGGNVNITGKSSVGGDLLAAGGNVTVDAPVAGMARLGGGSVTVNSRINGDVYVQSSQRLVFGPNAEVTGTVHYKGPQQAVVQPGARVGEIQYTQYQHKGGNKAAGLVTAAFLIQLLAWLAAGFVVWGLFKGFVPRVAEETFRHPWLNLGIGLVGFIVVPIITILLLVTVIGYYLAIILGLVYILALMLASILAAISLGYLVLRWLSKPFDRIVAWQAILIGVVVWSLLRFIPVIGWIAVALIFLMVLGALMRMGRNNLIK